ncbi:hypothetical protein BDZ97DRAFT_927496 [Flammula alnicola]|nr:hypothetical protein BDZ97DRAFT_927496 [Flammula alnicola]
MYHKNPVTPLSSLSSMCTFSYIFLNNNPPGLQSCISLLCVSTHTLSLSLFLSLSFALFNHSAFQVYTHPRAFVYPHTADPHSLRCPTNQPRLRPNSQLPVAHTSLIPSFRYPSTLLSLQTLSFLSCFLSFLFLLCISVPTNHFNVFSNFSLLGLSSLPPRYQTVI